jgi:hypothetical protein
MSPSHTCAVQRTSCNTRRNADCPARNAAHAALQRPSRPAGCTMQYKPWRLQHLAYAMQRARCSSVQCAPCKPPRACDSSLTPRDTEHAARAACLCARATHPMTHETQQHVTLDYGERHCVWRGEVPGGSQRRRGGLTWRGRAPFLPPSRTCLRAATGTLVASPYDRQAIPDCARWRQVRMVHCCCLTTPPSPPPSQHRSHAPSFTP